MRKYDSKKKKRCPECKKLLHKTSINKHRKNVHGKDLEIEKIDLMTGLLLEPFHKISDDDGAKILMRKLEGCMFLFNGTKESRELHFGSKEIELMIDCVKEVLTRKEQELS